MAASVVNDIYARSASDVWAAGGFAWGCDVSGDFVSTVNAPRPAGHDIDLRTLAVQGGTVWAGGVEFPQGDPPDPTGNGLYLRTG